MGPPETSLHLSAAKHQNGEKDRRNREVSTSTWEHEKLLKKKGYWVRAGNQGIPLSWKGPNLWQWGDKRRGREWGDDIQKTSRERGAAPGQQFGEIRRKREDVREREPAPFGKKITICWAFVLKGMEKRGGGGQVSGLR